MRLRLARFDTPGSLSRMLARIGVDRRAVPIFLEKIDACMVVLGPLPAYRCTILKQEMLSSGGDAAIHRGCVDCSVPESEALLIGTVRQLKRFRRRLDWQIGGFEEIARFLDASLDPLTRDPGGWLAGRRQLLPSDRGCLVMGVLNVTPDSFHDGGAFVDAGTAVRRGIEIENQGADLVDVGGESSRPGSPRVGPDVELARVVPVLDGLRGKLSIPLSIDTWKAPVAAAAIERGADVVNDISGLRFDPELAGVIATAGAGLVLMHTPADPSVMQSQAAYDDVIGELLRFFEERLAFAVRAGIAEERIAIDPGLGFGKTLLHNRLILRNLFELNRFGRPVVVGASRKSFLGLITGRDTAGRLAGSVAVNTLAIRTGASVLRVHDVPEAVDALRVVRSLSADLYSEPAVP